jgi:hypothetical protein
MAMQGYFVGVMGTEKRAGQPLLPDDRHKQPEIPSFSVIPMP